MRLFYVWSAVPEMTPHDPVSFAFPEISIPLQQLPASHLIEQKWLLTAKLVLRGM